MATIGLKLLGAPHIECDGRLCTLGQKPLVLLVLLAYWKRQGRTITRDETARCLWPDQPAPLTNLSTALGQLRRTLGNNCLDTDERHRTLWLNVDVQCDAWFVIEAAINDHPSVWREASAHKGRFLEFPDPQWDSSLSSEFQEWLNIERAHITEARRELASRLGAYALQQGEFEDAVTYLELVRPEPGDPREEDTFRLMLTYLAIDQAERAVGAYGQLVGTLRDLGAKPGADAEAAFAIARTSEVAAARAWLLDLFPSVSGALDLPFVGRDMELKTLESKLPHSFEGKAWACLIFGEPGIGKTELARQAIRRLDPHKRRFLIAEGFAERHSPSWRALDLAARPLVRSRRIIIDALGPELKASLGRFLPDLLEAPPQDIPLEEERLLFLALRALLSDESRPTLLFVDDVQWLDEGSLGFLLELLRKPPPRGLLLIATLRDTEPSKASNTLSEAIYRTLAWHEIHLESLPETAVAELATFYGRDTVQPKRLREQTGGNPLYLLETLRAATDDPTLTSLWSLIRTRIETFHSMGSERDVLEACAVLGDGAGLAEISATANQSYEDTVLSLTGLRRARLLQPGERSSRFNHEITREVTMHYLPPERAQLFHLRAARARANRPELAAGHYWAIIHENTNGLEPSDMTSAIEVFSKIGTLEIARGHLDSGEEWFRRALVVATVPEQRFPVFVQRGRAFGRSGHYEEAILDLDRADAFGSIVNGTLRAQLFNARAVLAHDLGQLEAVKTFALRALEFLDGLATFEALAERASSWHYLGLGHWMERNFTEAEHFTRQALELRRSLNRTDQMAESLHNLGVILTERDFTSARDALEEAGGIWEAIGHPANLVRVLNSRVLLEWRWHHLDEAEANLERALEIGRSLNENFYAMRLYNQLGVLRLVQGKYDEARSAYEAAAQSPEAASNPYLLAILLGNLAEVSLRLGRFSDAKSYIGRGLELVAHLDAREEAESYLKYYRAELAVIFGNIEDARLDFAASVDSAKRANDIEREAEALARLSRLDGSLTLADEALERFDSNTVRASRLLISGNLNLALNELRKAKDIYEEGRLLLDAARIDANETLNSQAQFMLKL